MAIGIPAPPHQSSAPRATAGVPRRTDDPADPGVGERGERDFLGSHRALPVCTREFDRLSAAVAEQLAALDHEALGAKPEVRRSPGRCIVQLGPVALTLSWVRSRVDTVAAGRLLVVEWVGTVARGSERIPERMPAARQGKAATAVRDEVFLVDATSEQDWRWRPEAAPIGVTSTELARRITDSLLTAFRAQS